MRTTVVANLGLEEDPQPAVTTVMDHALADTAEHRNSQPFGGAGGRRGSLGPGLTEWPTAQAEHDAEHDSGDDAGVEADQPVPGGGNEPPPPADRSAMLATVCGVHKAFGSVEALTGLQIDIPPAKITVLLGPNGAGKTTAIRMITGAMTPDKGSVQVFGVDPAGADGEQVRRRCGVVSAKPSLYDRLSGMDNLRYAAELYGLGRGAVADRGITEAATTFGIHDALDQRVGGYSTGMKTRLALARAILHDPELLLLDEPTSGLDPESAQSVLNMVRHMTEDGRTVLMCTHLLAEAEGLADEVVIIQDGTTLLWGNPADLGLRYWPNLRVAITAESGPELDDLSDHPAVLAYERAADQATIEVADSEAVGDLVRRLTVDGVRLRAVVPYEPSLEDLYFAVRREHGVGR